MSRVVSDILIAANVLFFFKLRSALVEGVILAEFRMLPWQWNDSLTACIVFNSLCLEFTKGMKHLWFILNLVNVLIGRQISTACHEAHRDFGLLHWILLYCPFIGHKLELLNIYKYLEQQNSRLGLSPFPGFTCPRQSRFRVLCLEFKAPKTRTHIQTTALNVT